MTTVPSADTSLELAFGDPWQDSNPVGFAAILQADERQEMPAAGEALLDQVKFSAEFVPASLGGRFTRVDRFARLMRTVFRHDPCLGLGYGFSSFIAGVNVWAAGSAEQQQTMAELLLSGRKVASAYHELDHGNDFSAAECLATPEPGGGWRLNGRKEVVTNMERAAAFVLFARTSAGPGSRSHSQFLVRKDSIATSALSYLPRFPSAGMRGVPLGGATFTNLLLPATSMLGRPGQGVETALCTFQLTRATMPAMLSGSVDTGLRATAAFARERRLYGQQVAELPQVRAVLGEAFTDLLIADSFCTVVTRALHLLPGQTPVYASAVKHLVSRLLLDTMDSLAAVIGAQSYLRDGRYAIFGKQFRDLAPAGFAHASRAACVVTLLPQLPRLARRSWFAGGPAPRSVFRPGDDLPPLDFGRLIAGSPADDSLAGTLAELSESGLSGPLAQFACRLRDELRWLGQACADLRPRDLTIDASTAASELAARYTVVLAGTACLAVWYHNRDHPSDLVRDESWVIAALWRLIRRLPGPPPVSEAMAAAATEVMAREALAREENHQSYDLTGWSVPG